GWSRCPCPSTRLDFTRFWSLLGCPLVRPHKCVCGSEVDELGHHGLSCRRSAGRHRRHTFENDVIVRAVRSAPSHFRYSSSAAGSTAERADEQKRAKYSELTGSGNYMFFPVAVETLGAWGPSALALCCDIGGRLV